MKPIEATCVGIVTVLMGLALLPLVRHSYAVGELSTLAQCGKNIYMAVAHSGWDAEFNRLDHFQNSTDYFREKMLDSENTNRALRLFDLSAGMMPVCKTADLFSSSNNAWVVRASPTTDDKHPLVPLLLSRNLDVSHLSDGIIRSTPPTYNLGFKNPDPKLPKWGAWAVVVVDGGAIFTTSNVRRGFRLPQKVGVSTNGTPVSLNYLTPDGEQKIK
jgi:hypothetical protein